MTQSTRIGVVDTDVPTSENFYTGAVIGPRWDVHRRYGINGGWKALAPIPPNFGTPSLANGIMGYVATTNVDVDQGLAGPHAVHLFAHGVATADRHNTGWVNLGHAVHDGQSPLRADVPSAALAGQRYGPRVVGIVNVGVTNEGVAPFRRTVVLDAASIDYQLHFTDQPTAADGYAEPVTAGDIYVSDAADPFIWTNEGFGPGNNYVEFTGFRLSHADALGINRTVMDSSYVYHRHRSGPTGAHRCRIYLPDGWIGAPPRLVKPWATDPSEPPEVWFFRAEHQASRKHRSTGRIVIYRAQWKPNLRIRAHDTSQIVDLEHLDDDPAFTSGRRRFPRRNPGGYAFEPNCFTADHQVGVAGPFPTDQPDMRIHIDRDRKRPGVLHMSFVASGNPYYSQGVADIWYCTSHDDGRHWSAPVHVMNLESDQR